MPRTKGAPRKEYVPLTMTDLSTSVMASPDEVRKLAPAKLIREPAERSATMKQFDEWVQELYAFWTGHGKPQSFTDAYPPRKVFGTPDQAATIRFLARKSAQFLDHGIAFGKDTPTQDGRVCVSFCVTDKKARTVKAKPESDGLAAS